MGFRLTNGAVFLHIPKTGGSFVQQALREQGLIESYLADMHHDMDRMLYQERFGAGRDFLRHLVERRLRPDKVGLLDSYRFCFVRHPLTWLESFWRWKTGNDRGWEDLGDPSDIRRWHPLWGLHGLDTSNFATFVRGVLKVRPGFVTELYSYYTKYGVSYIGQQETLIDDLVEVLKTTNANFDEDRLRSYQRINSSRGLAEECTWDEDLREEILVAERAGLLLYGYETSALSGPSPWLRGQGAVAQPTARESSGR